ncbi:hypothetical protein ATANTOWER_006594 [Ataeniobius toweri]|uniref:Uncharacterized protein n=1 Tax=Ataeniobius toweri TaxID=208326 RepID=A0ABU7B7R6_9TELE|nr:hypothetical protein [Ataeniobius toweri]
MVLFWDSDFQVFIRALAWGVILLGNFLTHMRNHSDTGTKRTFSTSLFYEIARTLDTGVNRAWIVLRRRGGLESILNGVSLDTDRERGRLTFLETLSIFVGGLQWGVSWR